MRRRGFERTPDGTISTFAFNYPQTSNPIQYAAGIAINPRGQVLCTANDDIGNYDQGYVKERDGTSTTIDIAASRYVFPTGINAAGQVTGSSQRGAFLWKTRGTLEFFDVAGQSAFPQGITAAETMGYYVDALANYHGFVRNQAGDVITFNVPNATQMFPRAVNAAGIITGVYTDASYLYHGFVRQSDGTLTTFDVPNATYTYPTAISTSGDITGWYVDSSNTVHGFVRTR